MKFQRILTLLLIIQYNVIIQAAHSNKRHTFVRSYTEPKNTQYDRSITIFSDEGRLLQVEYAIDASTRGNSVICLNYNGSIICSAIVTQEGDDDDANEREEEDDIILYPQEEKIHRIDNNCFLITTGISGDGNALANTSRMLCQRLRRENSDHNEKMSSTVPLYEIANSISGMQHELTRTSGSRPFGVSATILGMDKTTKELHLYQSEAGGILDEYDFISCGKNSKVLQEKLYELWLVLSKIQEDEQMIKEKMITGMANILFNNIKNVKCIDIWMFKKNLNISRSGMDIDCAKAINRNQVDDLYTYF